jgi:anaphase-promoting complex subunit 2
LFIDLLFLSHLEKYAKEYEHVKRPRQLTWKPHLGNVQLDLEFEDRTLPFTVSPIHAAIISYFQDDNSMDTIVNLFR